MKKTRSGNVFWEVVPWGRRGNRKNLLPSAFWGSGNGFSKGRTLLYYTIGFSKGRTLLYYTILPSNAKLQPTRKLSHHARETSWGRVISLEGKGKEVPPLQSQPFPFQSVTRWESLASQHTETHRVNQNNRKKQGKSVYPQVLEQPKLTILG